MDKDTLQNQLNTLLADAKTIATGVQQRIDLIQKFTTEIEQHRGAQAYNLQLTQAIQKQLTELATSSPSQ